MEETFAELAVFKLINKKRLLFRGHLFPDDILQMSSLSFERYMVVLLPLSDIEMAFWGVMAHGLKCSIGHQRLSGMKL